MSYQLYLRKSLLENQTQSVMGIHVAHGNIPHGTGDWLCG